MSYSYLSSEHYFYESELLDLIKTIKIERQAMKDNKLRMDTSFADDLIKALGLQLKD